MSEGVPTNFQQPRWLVKAFRNERLADYCAYIPGVELPSMPEAEITTFGAYGLCVLLLAELD